VPLKVHFLNVGIGDCTIVEFPSGRVAMIDIDNLKILDDTTRAEVLASYRASNEFLLRKAQGMSDVALLTERLRKVEEQLTDPLAYYDTRLGSNTDVFRFIVTHPDMDHLTGLYRLHMQDTRKSILNMWHIGPHDFNLADSAHPDWSGRYDKRDWDTYRSIRDGSGSPKSLLMNKGSEGHYWTEDGVELWAPTDALVDDAVEAEDSNPASMILCLTHGYPRRTRIVLGGDATADETWPAIWPYVDMKGISILKASHHGRRSGYHQLSVKEMSPWLTITSVEDEEHDATPLYRQYSEHTVSLLKVGDIQITVNDDGTWTYSDNVPSAWKPKL